MITFEDIPGRSSLKRRLYGEVQSGHAGHAYILEGSEGCGKRDIAKAFSYTILCLSEQEVRPCGTCRHCRMINAGGTGELRELAPTGGSISITAIREMQENMYLLPVSGNRKVYLIAEADSMTVPAQNCILKTLEEPPPYATIIMTTANSDRLIETIRSRSVMLQVGINSVEEIRNYLEEKTNCIPEEIEIASRCANGSVGKAREILESGNFAGLRDEAVEFASFIISKDYKKAYSAIAALSKGDGDVFYSSLSGIMRDMLVFRETGDQAYLINRDKRDIIIKGSKRYPGHILSRMISIINDASDRTKANAARKQTMDAMIVRITEELAEW